MAKITITIPDADLSRVEDAIAIRYDRLVEIPNPSFDDEAEVSDDNPIMVPNTETKKQFLKRWMMEHLENVTKGWEHDESIKAAREAAPTPRALSIT